MPEKKHLGVSESAGCFVIRYKTAGSKNKSIVLHAARHNGREIMAELHGKEDHGRIDSSLTHLNRRIHGPESAEDTAALAKTLIKRAGCKVRANAALVIEVMFSLSSDATVDQDAYFGECVTWAADTFGGIENVLRADIHRDQTHPHLHVLIIPIVGNVLAATKMMSGHKTRLDELTKAFARAVADKFGLKRNEQLLTGRSKSEVASDVIHRLVAVGAAVTTDSHWIAFRRLIEQQPFEMAERLGIKTGRPPKKVKSMTDIFISKGAGSKREETPSPFGVEPVEHLSCVGVCNEERGPTTPPAGHAHRPQPGAKASTRQRRAAEMHMASTADARADVKAPLAWPVIVMPSELNALLTPASGPISSALTFSPVGDLSDCLEAIHGPAANAAHRVLDDNDGDGVHAIKRDRDADSWHEQTDEVMPPPTRQGVSAGVEAAPWVRTHLEQHSCRAGEL